MGLRTLNLTAPWLCERQGFPEPQGFPERQCGHARGRARVHKPNDPIPSQHTLLHSLFSIHLHQPQCLRIFSTEHQVHSVNRAWSGKTEVSPVRPTSEAISMPTGTSAAHPSPPPQQPAARERGAAVLLPLPCPLSLEVLQADQIR